MTTYKEIRKLQEQVKNLQERVFHLEAVNKINSETVIPKTRIVGIDNREGMCQVEVLQEDGTIAKASVPSKPLKMSKNND